MNKVHVLRDLPKEMYGNKKGVELWKTENEYFFSICTHKYLTSIVDAQQTTDSYAAKNWKILAPLQSKQLFNLLIKVIDITYIGITFMKFIVSTPYKIPNQVTHWKCKSFGHFI